MKITEVAPPGFGHTKGDKKKGVEKGGTAAAFDRARKEGRFKGSKSDMFAIMWSQKNKGDKPHYKPGTDKKYKKYQDESFEIDKSAHKAAQKKSKMRNLARGNENPNEKAAAERKAGGPKLMGEAQNAAQQAAIAVSKKKRLEDMMVSKKKKLKETVEMTRQKWKKTHKDFRNDDEKNPDGDRGCGPCRWHERDRRDGARGHPAHAPVPTATGQCAQAQHSSGLMILL